MNPNHGIGLASIIELVLVQPGSSFVLYPERNALRALHQFLSWDFNCRFTLQVHTVVNLPSGFNGSSLLCHWEGRDDEDLVAEVIGGVAEFEERLMTRTFSISCNRTGPYLSAVTYCGGEERFLIYAPVDGSPVGVHRIDLTEILAPMLEERRQERWNVTYELQGDAAGAVMNVSFQCLVLGNNMINVPLTNQASLLSNQDQPSNDERTEETDEDQLDEVVTTTDSEGTTTPPGLGDNNNLEEDQTPPSDGQDRTPVPSDGQSPERTSSSTKSRSWLSYCCFHCCNLFKGCLLLK